MYKSSPALFLLMLFVSLLLNGCKGDDRSNTTLTSDTTAPQVSSATPATDATGVEPVTNISIVFNEDILETSVSNDSVMLTRNDNDQGIAGYISFDGVKTMVFTPDSPLALLGHYTATVTGVADLAGNLLPDPYSWSFAVRDGAWGEASLLETTNLGDAWYPQIAVDAAGNTIAVWQQSDGTRLNIWSNRYAANTDTWGTAELIEIDDNGHAGSPQIAIDIAGNAIAVWQQSDGTHRNIWTTRYTVATDTWGTAEKIETGDAGDAVSPQIAVDTAGNAVAVWVQDDGLHYYAWANHYTADTDTWGAAKRLETNITANSLSPQISMDSAGNAIAVWVQYDKLGIYSVWSSRFVADTGAWDTAELIETDNFGHAEIPQITVDDAGNAIAVWEQQSVGLNSEVWVNHFAADTDTWGSAKLLDTDNTWSARDPQIAVDAAGNAIAVWTEHDNTRYNVWTRRYEADTNTWSTAELIETDNTGDAEHPQIAVDASSNALAVWYQHDGTRYNIWANRYTEDTGTWGTAVLLEAGNAGHAGFPQITLDSVGNATTVWFQNDGTYDNIWAKRFD